MKKLLFVAVVVLLLVPSVVFAKGDKPPKEPDKWYVCKYVGQPGDFETLQTGQNPIFVDGSSLGANAYIGADFADAHGHSKVVAGPYDKKLEVEPTCPTTPPPPPVCEDETATNYGGPLPCEYPPPPVCEDEVALNYGGELPCEYPPPPPVCEDEAALNYGEEGECEYPPPPVCEYNQALAPDDPKCKPPEVCKEEKLYKMATFEFPSGQVGTLVSWDGYPPNVSRQLCWFGEIATNMPIFEYVTRNSCTGEIHYNGELYDYYNPALETPHWSGTCAVGGCG